MRVKPTIKVDIDTEYDPAAASDVPEIIEHETQGLKAGDYEPYIIKVYLGSEEKFKSHRQEWLKKTLGKADPSGPPP